MKEELKAYHGDASLKQKWITTMKRHKEAETLIQGDYWEDGRGCFIGCTVHSDDVQAIEEGYGFPVLITRLIEHFFERLPEAQARVFAVQILKAVPVGVNLLDAWPPFAKWLMQAVIEAKPSLSKDVRQSVQRVRDLYAKGWPAADAADAAAYAADCAYVRAYDPARSAAYAAARAAYAADDEGAADAADAAADAVVLYKTQAAKFIEIVKTLKAK